MTTQKLLSEEELDSILALALEKTTVEDVLAIIDDCKGAKVFVYGYDLINPPISLWKTDLNPPGFLSDDRHLQPIYRHAIRLIASQEDALSIYDGTLLDGIPHDEALASFLIALEFCDSKENLNYILSFVLDRVNEEEDLFKYQELFLAIFEKRQELSKH